MSPKLMDNNVGSRHIARSIGAQIAGFMAGAMLPPGTDIGLRAIGLFPAPGQPMFNSGLRCWPRADRSVYGITSGCIAARLASHRPMPHALGGGFVGVVLNIAATVAT